MMNKLVLQGQIKPPSIGSYCWGPDENGNPIVETVKRKREGKAKAMIASHTSKDRETPLDQSATTVAAKRFNGRTRFFFCKDRTFNRLMDNSILSGQCAPPRFDSHTWGPDINGNPYPEYMQERIYEAWRTRDEGEFYDVGAYDIDDCGIDDGPEDYSYRL